MTKEELKKITGLSKEQKDRLKSYLERNENNFKRTDFPYLKSKDDVITLLNRLLKQDSNNAVKKANKEAQQKEKDSFMEYVESLQEYGITLTDCKEILKNHLKDLQKEKIQAKIEALQQELNNL